MNAAKSAKISALIAKEIQDGKDVSAAIDAVLGAGVFSALASELYDALRTK